MKKTFLILPIFLLQIVFSEIINSAINEKALKDCSYCGLSFEEYTSDLINGVRASSFGGYNEKFGTDFFMTRFEISPFSRYLYLDNYDCLGDNILICLKPRSLSSSLSPYESYSTSQYKGVKHYPRLNSFFWITNEGKIESTTNGFKKVPKEYRHQLYPTYGQAEETLRIKNFFSRKLKAIPSCQVIENEEGYWTDCVGVFRSEVTLNPNRDVPFTNNKNYRAIIPSDNSCTVFVGEWKDGYMHGEGILTQRSGHCGQRAIDKLGFQIIGNWNFGQLEGKARCITTFTKSRNYFLNVSGNDSWENICEYKDGKLVSLVDNNGVVDKGIFSGIPIYLFYERNDKERVEFGLAFPFLKKGERSIEGFKLDGTFALKHQNGINYFRGTIYYPNGDKYFGSTFLGNHCPKPVFKFEGMNGFECFTDGGPLLIVKNGEGKLTKANGQVINQEWSGGKLKSKVRRGKALVKKPEKDPRDKAENELYQYAGVIALANWCTKLGLIERQTSEDITLKQKNQMYSLLDRGLVTETEIKLSLTTMKTIVENSMPSLSQCRALEIN